ncbi:hypothetical protein [Photobacterium leiognathi]|uniref:Uncharacterized protein n=1 Tax=Photobacterium leiognathi TaxID=553611 RepID=A0ABX5GJB8_PHOLE|nr:hypothetical protein [Photobacterium leiognathi]KJF91400.1 hypothetical protein UB42_02760 [Photobacterium leiognathi]PSV85845.1 hypothetical protein CTM94_03755 [Photobacterium leiognathi]
MKKIAQCTGIIFIVGLFYVYLFQPNKDVYISPSFNKVESNMNTTSLDITSGEVAEIPYNFKQMIRDETPSNNFDIYVAEDNIEGNPQLHGIYQPLPKTSLVNINLRTGEELWHYRPNLLNDVIKVQGVTVLPKESIVEFNEFLLTDLKIGDSLFLTLPSGLEQQIVIAKIDIITDKVTAWDLQNTQQQHIGKITKIDYLTEGSFITDNNEEYHLRTVNLKGWITTKNHLISNNNEAVKNNSNAFLHLIE